VGGTTETREADWDRAKRGQGRVRMEEWEQKRLGWAEKCAERKKFVEKSKKTLDRDRPSHGRT